MLWKYRKLFVVFVLIVTVSGIIFSESKEKKTQTVPLYSLGDQTLSINGGLFVPLFFQATDGSVKPTNLTPGGVGSLKWGVYLNGNVKVNLEAGGVFAFSPNFNTLLILPITLSGEYVFNYFPFNFPVYLGTGITITRYQTYTHVDFILKPGLSAYWQYNTLWSFGINFVYWWIFQPATGDQPSYETRMGNFLEISLSALYHF